MAATSFTPISLYYSTTASAAPTAGNLVAGELAINTNDGVLYYKDSSGIVQTLATKATTAGTFTSISDAGNLTFTGTGNRITGDFSNATLASRVAFQTSTVNTATWINVLPNGTATSTFIQAYNNSDPTNSSYTSISASSTESQLFSGIRGTGTYLPLVLYTGGSERLRIDTSGNVGIGASTATYKLTVNTAVAQAETTTGLVMQLNGSNATSLSAGILNINSNDSQGVDLGGSLTFGGNYIGTSNGVSFAGIAGRKEDGTSGNTGGYLQFTTRNNGGNTSERMRIDSSGNVGIGTSSPSASAILDAQSTTKGVRMPNMTTTQKNAISSPAAGLMVFDTTLAKLCVYSGAAWQTITSL